MHIMQHYYSLDSKGIYEIGISVLIENDLPFKTIIQNIKNFISSIKKKKSSENSSKEW